MSPYPRPRVALIAAVSRNGLIGKNGTLPWHLPIDLKHFKALTSGKRIVMGRRTWESFPKPLPNREHVVVTSKSLALPAGVIAVPSLSAALALPNPTEPVFVIGGSALYAEAIPLVDDLYLTEVQIDAVGDTTFPAWNRAAFHEQSRESSDDVDRETQASVKLDFVHYARR